MSPEAPSSPSRPAPPVATENGASKAAAPESAEDLEAQLMALEAEYTAQASMDSNGAQQPSDSTLSSLADAHERLKRPLFTTPNTKGSQSSQSETPSSPPPPRATSGASVSSPRRASSVNDPLQDPLDDPAPSPIPATLPEASAGIGPGSPSGSSTEGDAAARRKSYDTTGDYRSARSDSAFGDSMAANDSAAAETSAQRLNPTPASAAAGSSNEGNAQTPSTPDASLANLGSVWGIKLRSAKSSSGKSVSQAAAGGGTTEPDALDRSKGRESGPMPSDAHQQSASGGGELRAPARPRFEQLEVKEPDSAAAEGGASGSKSEAASQDADGGNQRADGAALAPRYKRLEGQDCAQDESLHRAGQDSARGGAEGAGGGCGALEGGSEHASASADTGGAASEGWPVAARADSVFSAASPSVAADNGTGDGGEAGGRAERTEEAEAASAPLLLGGGEKSSLLTMLCSKKRQFFVFSNSGRPIFTRHGDLHAIAGITSLFYGLLACSEDALDELPQVMKAGRHVICVRAKPSTPEAARPGPDGRSKGQLQNSPIVAVVVSRAQEPPLVLKMQLELLHLQLLAWTTLQVETALIKRPNTDIDHLLVGTHATFEVLLKRFAASPDYFLTAVEVFRLPVQIRASGTRALQQAVNDAGALYGFIACGHRLIAQAHNATKATGPIHVWDLLLLMNFVASNPSFQTQYAGQQVFVPMCCPKTAPDAFMHVYVHFPNAESPLFVMLIGAAQADFYNLHTVRLPLMQALEASGQLQLVSDTVAGPNQGRLALNAPPLDTFPTPLPGQEKMNGLAWYLVVVDPVNSQLVMSAPTPPIDSKELQKFALLDIMRLHSSMWMPTRLKLKGPMKFQWRATPRWVLVGMIDDEREVYCIMDPLVPKQIAIALLRHLMRCLASSPDFWLCKSP